MQTSRWRLGALVAALGLLTAGEAFAQARTQITIPREVDADRYDPHRSTARAAGEVIHLMADTLVTLDWDLKTVKPGLATEWSSTPDGLTYTFKIRDDVSFCSGRKMTAADAAYSITRWVDPATRSPVAWRAGNVKRVHAPDATTLVYELNEPHSELLYQLSLFFGAIIDKDSVDTLGQDFGVRGFNGTGPYCWVEWQPRSRMVLQRNPNYRWGPPIYQNRGPANIERIVWTILPEENVRTGALLAGQADITQYVPLSTLTQLRQNRNLTVVQPDNYFWLYFIGFKIDKPSVNDPRVRRAMNHAVDQQAIANSVFFGHAKPATTYVAPGVLDFYEGVTQVVATYDPAAANRLLDEAGWVRGADGIRVKDGQRLSVLTYGFTGQWQRIMEAVQGDLRRVGVDMQIQLFDATIAWGRLATQEFDAFGMSFPYVSAGDALNLYFQARNTPTPNRMNWRNEQTDGWLREGRTALDPAVRSVAYANVQRQVHEAAVWLPLVHEPMFLAANNRLTGVRAHGIYGIGLHQALDLRFR